MSVWLPDLMGATLAVFLARVGDFAIHVEADPDEGNFDKVVLERKFELLLGFKGVLCGLVAPALVPGASVVNDEVRSLKVLVDARKSSGMASPL